MFQIPSFTFLSKALGKLVQQGCNKVEISLKKKKKTHFMPVLECRLMLKSVVLFVVSGMSALQLQNLATIAAAAAAAQNTNPSSTNPMSSTNGGALGSLASQGA